MKAETIWWNQIPGPARYLNDTASADTTVLFVEETCYTDHFLLLLKDKLRQEDSNLQIDVSYAAQWAHHSDIGEVLMNQYAPSVDYHPMDGRRAAILAEKNLLAGRLLVIRQVEHPSPWLEFSEIYAKHSTYRRVIIILTYRGQCPLASKRKGISVLQWSEYSTPYDMQLFASYCISSRNGLSAIQMNYIAQVASRLAGTNPELCQALATEELALDPHGLLRLLADRHEGAARLIANRKILEHLLWEAQIQTVFPIIEQERRRFIEAYFDQLTDVLPQQDEFGKEIKDPQDMELRHIWYYYFRNNGTFNNNEEARRFHLLYNARNDLAHLDALNSQVVDRILRR